MANILVVDLESTCDEDSPDFDNEVIEVGAVWATSTGEILDTFQRFVRPIENPRLTPFCMALTHIEQACVDAAFAWPKVAAELAAFAQGHAGLCWASWGASDRRQIEGECARHGIADPFAGLPHRDLKATFAKKRRIKRVGMKTAMQIVGIAPQGDHHRALSDALNIAMLLPWSF